MDLDSTVCLTFNYADRHQPQLRALLEIVPMAANLDARRASLSALRELGRLSGLQTLVVEIDHRRKQFRVRSADRVLIFLGGDEKSSRVGCFMPLKRPIRRCPSHEQ